MTKYELDIGVSKIGGQYTFGGVVGEFFDSLSGRNWNEATKNTYKNYYNMLISRLDGKPLSEYAQEDFERAIMDIQREKTTVRKNQPFSESTLQRLRYLVRIVVRKGVEAGILSGDHLWGSCYSIRPKDDPEQAAERELVVLRKSLTPREELRIVDLLFRNPTQSGLRMGLLLMFVLGIRNGEACGLTYGAVREMHHYPGNYVIMIYQTTVGETSSLKAGGKTLNTLRKLPLPDKLFQMLERRREWVEEQMENGRIVLQPNQHGIEDLPIVCSDADATAHCTSRELTYAGKVLLKEIALNETELAYIDRELQNENSQMEMMGVKEKDPTAYLLRRNVATHLLLLGLTQSEIEAYMAHSILDPDVERSDFENEELLYKIKKKLDERPLVNDSFPSDEAIQISQDDPAYQFDITPHQKLEIRLQPGQAVHLHLEAAEPNQKLRMETNGPNRANKQLVSTKIREHTIKTDIRREINILTDYHRVYREAKTHFEKTHGQ